jgi:sec-independent protein translocase protein TatA
VIAHDILQPMHLLLILLAALLVLGPKRLPSASRAIGRSIREFRSATSLEAPAKAAAETPKPVESSAAGAAAPRV